MVVGRAPGLGRRGFIRARCVPRNGFGGEGVRRHVSSFFLLPQEGLGLAVFVRSSACTSVLVGQVVEAQLSVLAGFTSQEPI
jgi:hypothetical protein